MPVLPDEGSRITSPGRRRPSASAASTMALAIRSLTDPPGLRPSSFPTMRTSGLGDSALSSTIGVLPMRSRTEPTLTLGLRPGSAAAGDGGDDRHDVAGVDGRLETAGVTDVV